MSITVDLWQWRLNRPDPSALSHDEIARAERFVFARDRDLYIAGRGRLREIIGSYLNCSARDVRFDYGLHGRPWVEGVAFNLSHTGANAALVVTRSADVGVDIEAVKPIDLAVAHAHFAPSEIKSLTALPEAEQTAAFYRCWTRKEAFLKAKGTGLTTDLNSFTVTLTPDEAPQLLWDAEGDAQAWALVDFVPSPDTAGAIAIKSNGASVTVNRRG